jgi:hypothetical protein
MVTARFLIAILATAVVTGGVTAALADDADERPDALESVELRKDDSSADTELVDDDEDDDPTGDRDKTRGDDGSNLGHNHDRDATGGDDNTGGGDNSEVAVAPAAEPAPAPVYDDYSDDGYAYGGSDG